MSIFIVKRMANMDCLVNAKSVKPNPTMLGIKMEAKRRFVIAIKMVAMRNGKGSEK